MNDKQLRNEEELVTLFREKCKESELNQLYDRVTLPIRSDDFDNVLNITLSKGDGKNFVQISGECYFEGRKRNLYLEFSTGKTNTLKSKNDYSFFSYGDSTLII